MTTTQFGRFYALDVGLGVATETIRALLDDIVGFYALDVGLGVATHAGFGRL